MKENKGIAEIIERREKRLKSYREMELYQWSYWYSLRVDYTRLLVYRRDVSESDFVMHYDARSRARNPVCDPPI